MMRFTALSFHILPSAIGLEAICADLTEMNFLVAMPSAAEAHKCLNFRMSHTSVTSKLKHPNPTYLPHVFRSTTSMQNSTFITSCPLSPCLKGSCWWRWCLCEKRLTRGLMRCKSPTISLVQSRECASSSSSSCIYVPHTHTHTHTHASRSIARSTFILV